MADWFILRLPTQPGASASWMVTDAQGLVRLTPSTGSLSEAALQIANRKACVLVPANDVLLTDAELPAKAGAKMAQVVQYALEEQLAEDIDTLHFAIGKRAPGERRTPVAVVAKSLLEDWLATLTAAGITPDTILSEADLVPSNPGQIIAWLEGGTLVAREDGRAPAVLPVDGALRDAVLLANLPPTVSLQLCASPADWQPQAGELTWLQERFEGARVQLLPQGSLPWLASQIGSAPAINLLQGHYAQKSSHTFDWKQWRLAGALAIGLLGLHVVSKLIDIRQLAKAESTLDAEIDQVFRSAMPGTMESSDARRRMEQRVLALRDSGGGGGELLPALASLAVASGNAPGTTVRSLSFREGLIELKLSAPDADSLEKISRDLRAGGIAADVTGGAAADGAYEGRIRIGNAGPG